MGFSPKASGPPGTRLFRKTFPAFGKESQLGIAIAHRRPRDVCGMADGRGPLRIGAKLCPHTITGASSYRQIGGDGSLGPLDPTCRLNFPTHSDVLVQI
jgi:hypothetical protein